MCKIHRIHCSISTLKISIGKFTEFTVIFKKIGKMQLYALFLSGIYLLIDFHTFCDLLKD